MRFSCSLYRTHFGFVQLEPPAQAANLLLFKLPKTLLPPASADPDQDPENPVHQTSLSEELGDDFGAPALFDKGPLHEIRSADIWLMALGNREVIETGLGII